MDEQITVTMPVEEYERLKRIEDKCDDLIHGIEKCVEVQEVMNTHEVYLIIRTDEAVKLLAPYNDWDCELEHFDKVIIQPYKDLGADSVKIHEEEYCNSSTQLIDRGYEILINCQHDWKERWAPIPGEEHRSEPSHDECIKYGAEDYLVYDFKGFIKAKEDIPERMLRRIATLDRDKKRFGFGLIF